MLGVTVPDIHRSLDKAVQATMIPAARVRGIYIDAARLEQYEQALATAAIGGDEKAIATAVRVQERKATLSRFDTLPSRPSSHGFGEHHSAFFGETGLLAEGQIDQGTGGPIRADNARLK
jgi:hypothetical protein